MDIDLGSARHVWHTVPGIVNNILNYPANVQSDIGSTFMGSFDDFFVRLFQ